MKGFFGGNPQERARKKAERAARDAEELRVRNASLLARAKGLDHGAIDYEQRSKAAISIVLSGAYETGIEAWMAIAADFPEDRGTAYSQVGTCHHLLKDFRSALEFYAKAVEAGEDPQSLADSIASAEEDLRRVLAG